MWDDHSFKFDSKSILMRWSFIRGLYLFIINYYPYPILTWRFRPGDDRVRSIFIIIINPWLSGYKSLEHQMM